MKEDSIDLGQLRELVWSFAKHRVLTVAGRAGILNRLAERAAAPEELAGELGLDPLAAGKVVRALSAMNVLEEEDGSYRVARSLAPHFRRGPEDFTPFLEHSHHLYDSWGENLERWLRGEEWGTRKRDTKGVRKFGQAMQAMASLTAGEVASLIDLSGVKRMLDVGGGVGAYARAYCSVAEDLFAVVLDTPEVAAIGREMMRDDELRDRIEFKEGDYLETDYGSDYDLVQIASVLHQEPPDRAASLVRRGARALAPGGRLAVIDFSIDDAQNKNLTGCLFAINMRSFGDTYTEPTIRSWMTDVGLADIERVDLDNTRWIILGRKPRQQS